MEKPEPSLDLFDFISERGVNSEGTARSIFKQVTVVKVVIEVIKVIVVTVLIVKVVAVVL